MKINTWVSLLFVAVTFNLFSLNSFAQVTIGSGLAPESGAILQLKESNSEGANATRGLGLPRVALTTIHGLIDVGVNPTDEKAHTGLVVYSPKEDFCGLDYIYNGIYVWEGEKWEYLGEKIKQVSNVHTFVDPRDGEKYRYRDFVSTAGVWMI